MPSQPVICVRDNSLQRRGLQDGRQVEKRPAVEVMSRFVNDFRATLLPGYNMSRLVRIVAKTYNRHKWDRR
jgi:hypothetical protein